METVLLNTESHKTSAKSHTRLGCSNQLTTSADTVIITTCRCGWIGVAPTFDAATYLHAAHEDDKQETTGGFTPEAHKSYAMAMSNPMGNAVVTHLLRQARIHREEWAALHFIEQMSQQSPVEQTRGFFFRLVDRFMGGPAELHYGDKA